MKTNLKSVFPILDWLPKYQKKHLKGDVSAGLTVGIMLIPQGMAYAMLAGLPPIYGLYTAFVPQLVYAVLGTSRQLGVGPVAMDSLLVAVTIGQFAQIGTPSYISLAILLAFMVGFIQLLFGLLRMGFLVNFLSNPVISGFTSGAALIIGFSQLKYLMGVDLGRDQFLHLILWKAIQSFDAVNLYALALGVGGIICILLIKKHIPAVPAPLFVVLLGIALVSFFDLHQHKVDIVGNVPAGLPVFSIPLMDMNQMFQLISGALTIAIVAFMEAISVGKAIQSRHNDYDIRPNQELIALGAANLLGAFFQSFPGTGGFSRSAVNDQTGAKTNLAAIISALFVLLTLLFLTPFFYFLPKAILASIIMVAVFNLISLKDPIGLYRSGRIKELFILVITFLCTISIGIQLGILIGISLSVMNLIFEVFSINSCISIFNRIKNLFFPPEMKISTEKENCLRIHQSTPLFFINSAEFKTKIEKLIHESEANTILIEGLDLKKMDSTAKSTLDQIVQFCKEKKKELVIQDNSL